MSRIAVGEKIRGKTIREMVVLSNGWYLLKTDNTKSPRDFRVKTIYQTHPRVRSITPKHAHFAIDFYGKSCADKERAMKVFWAIIDVWQGKQVRDILNQNQEQTKGLPGYSLEYILCALKWILEQEDVNFKSRPREKQEELDQTLDLLKVSTPPDRLGSQLAISLLCNIAYGLHPVEALLRANLDVLPRKRALGAV